MFNEVVQKAAKDYSPAVLATYIYDLSKSFNHFYNEHKILVEQTEVKELRLFLTLAVSEILYQGLKLLGIEPIDNL